MDRREFVTRAAASLGAAALPPHLVHASPSRRPNVKSAGSRRPNLVYVFADQLRYCSCGYAGDEYARTPNMDRLAREGCNVHQAISSTPVCAVHRASLMTGKYQSSTGMVINELRLSPEHECFGQALTNAGYHTGYIGKWHMWANQLGHHNLLKNGFVPPGPYRLGFDGFWAAYNFNHYYFHSPYFLNDATPHIRKQYEPNGQTDMAIHFVREASKRREPFALFLSWGPPHYPWVLKDGFKNVQPEYWDLYSNVDLPLAPNYSNKSDPYCDRWQRLPEDYDSVVHDWMRAYYAQVANLDWNLGRLMHALDEQGVLDDTVLVFTSDHGEMFGSHGRQSKLIFYEEAARVPFLIRWPRKIPAKLVSDALLGTPDIMPTILSLLDVPIPRTVEGTDLSSAILGTGNADNDAAFMQGMGATAAWEDGSEWRALRNHEYTYAIYHRDGKELLFDNRKDPFQLVDLADDRSFSTTLAHYRTTSEQWRREHNDNFEACSWYKRWTEDRNIVMTATGVTQNLSALNEITDKWFPNGIGNRPVESWPVGC